MIARRGPSKAGEPRNGQGMTAHGTGVQRA
jgi:hypothetical protein